MPDRISRLTIIREKGQVKTSREVTTNPLTGEQQIRGFIARFEPERRALIRSVRRALRRRFPSANELVYDHSKSLVIGYSPIDRGIDSVVAIALGSDGLRLYFNQGARLPDPKKILLGSGRQTRFIRIDSPGTLKLPEVEALMEMAIDRAKIPLRPKGRGKLIVKSTSASRRRTK
jgi:hypothetical protein